MVLCPFRIDRGTFPTRDTHPRLTLADRYRLERELGQGGMATVYFAEDLKPQAPSARAATAAGTSTSTGRAGGCGSILRRRPSNSDSHESHWRTLERAGEALRAHGNRSANRVSSCRKKDGARWRCAKGRRSIMSPLL